MSVTDERALPTPETVSAEMARIRQAITPGDGGDKEDLITYAKEVVALRSDHRAPLPTAPMKLTPTDEMIEAAFRKGHFEGFRAADQTSRSQASHVEDAWVAYATDLCAAAPQSPLPGVGEMVETGWLIEENSDFAPHWIALSKEPWPSIKVRQRLGREHEVEKYKTPVVRVKDSNAALRFARKEDAEAFMAMFDRFLLLPVATEHQWSGGEVEPTAFSIGKRKHEAKTAASLTQAATPSEHMLRELLAVIHRDGGHYVEEHGLEKVVADAMRLSSERIAALSDVSLEVTQEDNKQTVRLTEWLIIHDYFFEDTDVKRHRDQETFGALADQLFRDHRLHALRLAPLPSGDVDGEALELLVAAAADNGIVFKPDQPSKDRASNSPWVNAALAGIRAALSRHRDVREAGLREAAEIAEKHAADAETGRDAAVVQRQHDLQIAYEEARLWSRNIADAILARITKEG